MGWNDLLGLGVVLALGALFALSKYLNDKDRGEEAPFGCGCSDADPQDPAAGCKGCPIAKKAQEENAQSCPPGQCGKDRG
ncbi:hypothetical protein [Paucidesulfovibrio longus]|uniref:hypothetical protein n=1 Tax=Paucidesulfovibrio longus TaxID=889 RepID=UPI0003B38CB4|nr:hypothetical protein [Paucidesulfovibrio longus]